MNYIQAAIIHARDNVYDMGRNPIDSRNNRLAWRMYNYAFHGASCHIITTMSDKAKDEHMSEYMRREYERSAEFWRTRQDAEREAADGQLRMF